MKKNETVLDRYLSLVGTSRYKVSRYSSISESTLQNSGLAFEKDGVNARVSIRTINAIAEATGQTPGEVLDGLECIINAKLTFMTFDQLRLDVKNELEAMPGVNFVEPKHGQFEIKVGKKTQDLALTINRVDWLKTNEKNPQGLPSIRSSFYGHQFLPTKDAVRNMLIDIINNETKAHRLGD